MAQSAAGLKRRPREVQGVSAMERREVVIQRRAVLVATILPFAGLLAAVITLWGSGLTLLDGILLAFFYVFTGFGITVGFHRLLTHRSFKARTYLRYAFAVAGTMAIQGSVIEWVADHRRHHAYADQEGDPHSPHLEDGEGIPGLLKGLWHAHMGWLFKEERTDRERWAPDLLKDPVMVAIDKAFLPLTIASFFLPPFIAFVITGSLWAALSALLWASLVRVFFLHHVTWSVNSICHFYGSRPYETSDFSTNNWALSLLSFGESWHNNHHAFPTSAVHGLGRWQLDTSAALIRVLAKLGLVRDLKLPSDKQLSKRSGF
jgi:stearoyl-CoA desaturase (delta-9 desaturase)